MINRYKQVEWRQTANVYEVNLRQYTEEGTFAAFQQSLPRLKDMGVQTLWFMPITPISEKEKKGTMGSYYACSDYTSVNPEFGSIEDFKNLVKEAHSMGFKVIIDWVANHTGWDHVWTKQHPDYYEQDEATNDFKRASGMEDIIELDYNNPAVRKAMIDAMKFWINECDIDGFRCDLAFWVQLDFWIDARTELDKVKELFWLGEMDELDNPDYMQVFDAAYTWTWMHKTEEYCKQQLSLEDLFNILLSYDRSSGDKGIRAWFTTNHDENSWNGTEYEKYGVLAKALAVFSCTWNGIPLVYSGQELPNYKRLKFFDKDVIEWNGKYELHDFYKTLLKLHSTHPALRAADTSVRTYRVHTNNDQSVLAYLRQNGEREILVLLNFSMEHNLTLKIDDTMVKGVFMDVFNGHPVDFSNFENLTLHPGGYRVYEK
jgi:alpha-amylase